MKKCLLECILAFLWILNLSAQESVPGFVLEPHTAHIKAVNQPAFNAWMVAKKPSEGKKALITTTVLDANYPMTNRVWWLKARISDFHFESLLNASFTNPATTIQTTSSFYTYTPDYAFWVDFANANTFGGGFRSHGNVQEERMFMEFPQLSQLAYALRSNSNILPVQHKNPEPFLIPRLLRKFNISAVPYGKALDKVSPANIETDVVQNIQRLPLPFPVAHIIGLAAKDYSKIHGARYSMSDLKYHLRTALLGWLAARDFTHQKVTPLQIHTGAWGAGAFKNSRKMLTALQILAAQMASLGTGSTLTFHAMRNSEVTEIANEIAIGLSQGDTPLDLLRKFKNKQNTDASWRPQ